MASESVEFDIASRSLTVENAKADTDYARPSHVLGSSREALLRVV